MNCLYPQTVTRQTYAKPLPETSYTIYHSARQLPNNWDDIAMRNICLSRSYLSVLELAAPCNMQCHFIGLFRKGQLAGIAVAQYINLKRIDAFAEDKNNCSLKDYAIKKLSSHILLIGNNMLTGQNAYLLTEQIPEIMALSLLHDALEELKDNYCRQCIFINLTGIKDFATREIPNFTRAGYNDYYKFCTQPNMIFDIRNNWLNLEDYVGDLNNKYRAQYNRARKKLEGIEKRALSAAETARYQARIHELYMTVADNASFNTFHLPQNHFTVLKQQLQDNFIFYGYFEADVLVGFCTMIRNGDYIDTYFLGYDAAIQKGKMLYLNMLYDMIDYGISHQYRRVVFARSAMEIKSSVGARAEKVYGIIKHTAPFINVFMSRLFPYFDPKVSWKERNPYKTEA